MNEDNNYTHTRLKMVDLSSADFETLAADLDIDWVYGLLGSRYGSGAEFLADVSRCFVPRSPTGQPDAWEVINSFGNVINVFYSEGPAKYCAGEYGPGHEIRPRYFWPLATANRGSDEN